MGSREGGRGGWSGRVAVLGMQGAGWKSHLHGLLQRGQGLIQVSLCILCHSLTLHLFCADFLTMGAHLLHTDINMQMSVYTRMNKQDHIHIYTQKKHKLLFYSTFN